MGEEKREGRKEGRALSNKNLHAATQLLAPSSFLDYSTLPVPVLAPVGDSLSPLLVSENKWLSARIRKNVWPISYHTDMPIVALKFSEERRSAPRFEKVFFIQVSSSALTRQFCAVTGKFMIHVRKECYTHTPKSPSTRKACIDLCNPGLNGSNVQALLAWDEERVICDPLRDWQSHRGHRFLHVRVIQVLTVECCPGNQKFNSRVRAVNEPHERWGMRISWLHFDCACCEIADFRTSPTNKIPHPHSRVPAFQQFHHLLPDRTGEVSEPDMNIGKYRYSVMGVWFPWFRVSHHTILCRYADSSASTVQYHASGSNTGFADSV